MLRARVLTFKGASMRAVMLAVVFGLACIPSIVHADPPPNVYTLTAIQVPVSSQCASYGYEAFITGDGYPSQVIMRITRPDGNDNWSFWVRSDHGRITKTLCLWLPGLWGVRVESGHTLNQTATLASAPLLVSD